MKGLRKFRLDHNASTWYFARLSMLSMDQYLRFEGMRDENIPTLVKDRFENIMNMGDEIDKYYNRAEEFYTSNDLKKILDEAKQTYDVIAGNIGVGVNVVKSILEDGEPFPDDNTRDKLIDFTMWVNDNLLHKGPDVDEIKPEVEKDILGPEPDEISNEELQFPELPSQDIVSDNVEGVSKDDEIAGLNRQIDWYEELLTCFTHLAELAYRNNK